MVTGGIGGGVIDVQATKYNLNGLMEDLPHLNHGRQSHACAWYWAEDGTVVYLVTGGWGRQDTQTRSDTEMLRDGASEWSINSPLPDRIEALKALTLNNVPFLFGKMVTFFTILHLNTYLLKVE